MKKYTNKILLIALALLLLAGTIMTFISAYEAKQQIEYEIYK